MTFFEKIAEDAVTVLVKVLAVWFGIWHPLKRYIVVASVTAGFVLLASMAFAAAWWGGDAGWWITDNIYKFVFMSAVVGLLYAHSLYGSRPALFFSLLLVALIFLGLMRSSNAGELTEPIPAAELKATPRGTGEDPRSRGIIMMTAPGLGNEQAAQMLYNYSHI